MATERRLIDASEAFEIARTSGLHDDFSRGMADLTSLRELLEDCSTVEAVEVVRCFECTKEGREDCPMVFRDNLTGCLCANTKSTDFCSYGERQHEKI